MRTSLYKPLILIALYFTAITLLTQKSVAHAQSDGTFNLLGHFGDGRVSAVFVDNNMAYITMSTREYGEYRFDDELFIVDVSNPINPTLIGQSEGLSERIQYGSIIGIQVIDDVAYITTDRNSSLVTIDVSDPAAPVLLTDVDMAEGFVTTDTVGSVAYVTTGSRNSDDWYDDDEYEENGLVIRDVSDPAAPVTLGSVDTDGDAIGVQVVGNVAYITDQSNGIVTVDVSDPAAPVILDSGSTALFVYDLYVVGDVIYTATYRDGLYMFEYNSEPTTPSSIVVDGEFLDWYQHPQFVRCVSRFNRSQHLYDYYYYSEGTESFVGSLLNRVCTHATVDEHLGFFMAWQSNHMTQTYPGESADYNEGWSITSDDNHCLLINTQPEIDQFIDFSICFDGNEFIRATGDDPVRQSRKHNDQPNNLPSDTAQLHRCANTSATECEQPQFVQNLPNLTNNLDLTNGRLVDCSWSDYPYTCFYKDSGDRSLTTPHILRYGSYSDAFAEQLGLSPADSPYRGVEMSVPLSLLDNPSAICVTAFTEPWETYPIYYMPDTPYCFDIPITQEGQEGQASLDQVPERVSVAYNIADGSNDAEELHDATMYMNSSDLEIGRDGGGLQLIGLRYVDVQLPPDASILDARLTMTVDEVHAEPTSATIYGSSDTAPFAEIDANISSRPQTSARVEWTSIGPWTYVDTQRRSPNLSSIVQELVNQHGSQADDSIVFVIEGDGKRTAKSFDGDPSSAPVLTITYMSVFAEVDQSPLLVTMGDSIAQSQMSIGYWLWFVLCTLTLILFLQKGHRLP